MFSLGGSFLVKTVFELYIMVLFLRLFMQCFRINFLNPVSQLVIKLTNPLLMPIKPYFPGYKGVDLGVVTVIYLFEVLKLVLVFKLSAGFWTPLSSVLVFGVFEMLSELAVFIFYLVLIRVVLSWVASPQTGPLQEISYVCTEPFLAPFRRLIPAVSGFDLSPLALMIVLQLANVMLSSVKFSML